MSKGFWEYEEEERKSAPDTAQAHAPEAAYHEIAVNCYHHPDRRASAICPKCSIYYCSECMTLRKGKLMCKTCAEVEFAVPDDQIVIGEEPSLEEQIKPERPPDFNPYGAAVHNEGSFANPLKRIFAFIFDVALARVFYFVLYFFWTFIILSISGKFNLYDFGLKVKLYWPAVIQYSPWYLFLIGDFLYFFSFLAMRNRTLAMSWFNLRIVTIYGDFVGITQVLIRTLVMMATANVTLLFAFFSPKRQALHDWIAQLVVINYSGIKEIDPNETVAIEM
ncbi:MAG: RDD family protein [bacterium]|jgi:uncharacterized RDD family membrane protein YckC